MVSNYVQKNILVLDRNEMILNVCKQIINNRIISVW